MAISWSRVADMSQRGVSLMLSGLTLVGLGVLANGGYGVYKRKKQRELGLPVKSDVPSPEARAAMVANPPELRADAAPKKS